MQKNAFAHNGSSIHEDDTDGYQTSYVYHLENPVRFEEEIRVTIEHGHGNHLSNEMSSVAYWYQVEPHRPFGIVSVAQRQPVLKDTSGAWQMQDAAPVPELNAEMQAMKEAWSENALYRWTPRRGFYRSR